MTYPIVYLTDVIQVPDYDALYNEHRDIMTSVNFMIQQSILAAAAWALDDVEPLIKIDVVNMIFTSITVVHKPSMDFGVCYDLKYYTDGVSPYHHKQCEVMFDLIRQTVNRLCAPQKQTPNSYRSRYTYICPYCQTVTTNDYVYGLTCLRCSAPIPLNE